MKTKRHLLLLALLIVLVAIPTSVVFAKELGLLTITGPGIKSQLSLNDHEAMMDLEQAGFFNTSALAKAPEGLNPKMGYNMTAHLNLDGKLVPFVQMVYYPTTEGQPGYIHYTGRLEGESLRTVDEWSVLTREADGVLRDLITANQVAIQSALIPASVKEEVSAASAAEPVVAAEPVTAPVTSTAPDRSLYIVLAIVTAAFLLLGAGLAIRRRTIGHTTT